MKLLIGKNLWVLALVAFGFVMATLGYATHAVIVRLYSGDATAKIQQAQTYASAKGGTDYIYEAQDVSSLTPFCPAPCTSQWIDFDQDKTLDVIVMTGRFGDVRIMRFADIGEREFILQQDPATGFPLYVLSVHSALIGSIRNSFAVITDTTVPETEYRLPRVTINKQDLQNPQIEDSALY